MKPPKPPERCRYSSLHEGACAYAFFRASGRRASALKDLCYRQNGHVTRCPSSVCHAHRKAVVLFDVVQKQSGVCQTCQAQRRTKELRRSRSLIKTRPFKIYERSFKTRLQWTVITLELKIVASPHKEMVGADIVNLISQVIKSKEQEWCDISFIGALNHYIQF